MPWWTVSTPPTASRPGISRVPSAVGLRDQRVANVAIGKRFMLAKGHTEENKSKKSLPSKVTIFLSLTGEAQEMGV